MPAKEFMTLLDVLQQEGTGSIKALDAVRSVGLASPEVTAFPVTVIDGTQYEINMPTGIPRFGFRPANAGAKNLTTEYTNKTVKCYYIDGPIAVDKAVVTSSARGAQLLTKETRSVTLGAMASIALQMWYRLPEQENVFPAISEQMGDYMTISADPSKQEDSEANRADNSGASAYLVILGDDFLHSIWGNKKTLSMSPVQGLYCPFGRLDGHCRGISVFRGPHQEHQRPASLDGQTCRQGEEPVSCGLARHDFLCGYERQCEIAVAGIQNPYACHRKRRNGHDRP